MNQTLVLLSVGVFAALLFGAVGLYRLFGDAEARRLRGRLRTLRTSKSQAAPGPSPLLTDATLSTIPGLDALLRVLPISRPIQLLLVQGDTKMRVGAFLLLVIGLASFGALLSISLVSVKLIAIPVAFFLGAIPFLWAHHRKVKRIKKFEWLFPDALDIITGALRSGLALTAAIQVVSEECADPVGREFTILFEETRLGIDMRDALRNLARRVDSKELQMFVIAVLLQRETGGNLAEILEGTAEVIRERLRILGDIRALTAQARISGVILAVLPLALAAFILVSAPEYMASLVKEPAGRHLIAAAACLQIIGFFVMRRIASIRV